MDEKNFCFSVEVKINIVMLILLGWFFKCPFAGGCWGSRGVGERRSRCVRAPRRKCEKLLRIRHGREWESMRMLTSAGVGCNRGPGTAAKITRPALMDTEKKMPALIKILTSNILYSFNFVGPSTTFPKSFFHLVKGSFFLLNIFIVVY